MQKYLTPLAILAAAFPLLARDEGGEDEINANDAANLVILDEVKVANLGIELVDSVEEDFEETVFAIGRINDIPTNHAAVSSRISGRAPRVSNRSCW